MVLFVQYAEAMMAMRGDPGAAAFHERVAAVATTDENRKSGCIAALQQAMLLVATTKEKTLRELVTAWICEEQAPQLLQWALGAGTFKSSAADVQALIDMGVDLERLSVDVKGVQCSAAAAAAAMDHGEALMSILKRCPTLCAALNENGTTPLGTAAFFGSMYCMAILVGDHAAWRPLLNEGKARVTALMCAVMGRKDHDDAMVRLVLADETVWRPSINKDNAILSVLNSEWNEDSIVDYSNEDEANYNVTVLEYLLDEPQQEYHAYNLFAIDTIVRTTATYVRTSCAVRNAARHKCAEGLRLLLLAANNNNNVEYAIFCAAKEEWQKGIMIALLSKAGGEIRPSSLQVRDRKYELVPLLQYAVERNMPDVAAHLLSHKHFDVATNIIAPPQKPGAANENEAWSLVKQCVLLQEITRLPPSWLEFTVARQWVRCGRTIDLPPALHNLVKRGWTQKGHRDAAPNAIKRIVWTIYLVVRLDRKRRNQIDLSDDAWQCVFKFL